MAVLFFCVLLFDANPSCAQDEVYSLKDNIQRRLGAADGISADILGRRGGYLHLSLDLSEYFIDNVYNSNDDRESDFLTVISPSVWFSIPRSSSRFLNLDMTVASPGGLRMEGPPPLVEPAHEAYRTLQLYLSYDADFRYYSANSSQNTDSHRADALLGYVFPGGLSASLVDSYGISAETRDAEEPYELQDYRSNLFSTSLTYGVGERLKLKGIFYNYTVEYEDPSDEFMDRSDNILAGYVIFKALPRTGVFVEYKYFDISYDGGIYDSTESHYMSGIQWDVTGRTKGYLKAGVGTKSFDDPAYDDSSNAIVESEITHEIDTRRSVEIKADAGTYETDTSYATYMLNRGARATYHQLFGLRYRGSLSVSYTNEVYKDYVDQEAGEREDDLYVATLTMGYKANRHLRLYVSYSFTHHDSNLDEYDYRVNSLMLSVSASL